MATASIHHQLGKILQQIEHIHQADPDLLEVEIGYTRILQNLTAAEGVFFIFFDVDQKDVLIRKVHTHGKGWQTEDSLQMGEAVSLTWGKEIEFQSIDADQSNTLNLVLPDGSPIWNILYVPLVDRGTLLGSLHAVNVKKEIPEKNHLLLLANQFVNDLRQKKQLQQLKIDNANLEAWRWELLQSRNTLRAMFDSLPTSIYIIDTNYRLVAINLSRTERVGKKPSELVGQVCYEVLYRKTQPCGGCRVHETMINGRIANRADRQWVNNDQVIDWEITTYPILDESETPAQVIIVEQDVTVEKRLESNLIQSEKLAAVGQLAAGVAHEINNPLSAVIANSQLLMREIPAEDIDKIESLKLIETAGLRASQVVRNLLGFARKEQYEFLPLDLNETLHNSITLVKHELTSRQVEVHYQLADNLPMINASKDHIQSVWINIILNALDSMEPGKGVLQISSGFMNKEFTVTISDNGQGIPPDQVSRIFEPFFTTKAPGRGTGLGLSLCHRIIKQHSGYIQVDSLVGSGTKFTIVLPKDPIS